MSLSNQLKNWDELQFLKGLKRISDASASFLWLMSRLRQLNEVSLIHKTPIVLQVLIRPTLYTLNVQDILYSVEESPWHCWPRHILLCLVAFCAGRQISKSSPCLPFFKSVRVHLSTSGRACEYTHVLNVAVCLASIPFLPIKFGGYICMSSPSERFLVNTCVYLEETEQKRATQTKHNVVLKFLASGLLNYISLWFQGH